MWGVFCILVYACFPPLLVDPLSTNERGVLPPKLYLVDFSSEPVKWNKYTCSFFRVQKSTRIFLGVRSDFFCNTCSYPLGENCKVSQHLIYYKRLGFPDLSMKPTSPQCFFPWLLLAVEQTTNDFLVFHSLLQSWGSCLNVSALGGYQSLRVSVFVMLGIPIESYEHVLGPPKVSLDFVKNNVFRFLSHFLRV